MSGGARAAIHLAALQHNLQQVRSAAPGARVMAVIKANGYGHGIVRVARALNQADAFAVACLDEAAVLRQAGFAHPIVLLEGVSEPAELTVAADNRLDMVVHSAEQIALLSSARLSKPVSVWLKVDTGMHRLGFAPEQARAAWQRLHDCAAVARPLRLLTHLANADRPDDDTTTEQLALFEQVTGDLAAQRSVANSAAILGWPQSHCDWVRPGIMLYGASPFDDQTGAAQGLRPAMTLSTRLIAVNAHKRGEAIGYGGTWTCPEDMPVGVAAIGYGDGYPRHAGNGTPVLVNGERAPLIGRVSMDMLCIDLRGQPRARPGDPVTLWGEGLPVEEIARAAGTISYELLCRVGGRVQFEEA